MSFGLQLSVSSLMVVLLLMLVPASDACLRHKTSGSTSHHSGQGYKYQHGRGHEDGRHRFNSSRPNILFILADDLGWNDVGWNNREVFTTNLDALAYNGVILNQSYVQPACTPSRAAYLTGRYPFKFGMQQGMVRSGVADYLPLELTLLPEKLRKLNYSTHLVGKWHLGHCRVDATPTFRGFDSFLGCYSPAQDFFSKLTVPKFSPGQPLGYDLRFNLDVLPSSDDVYTTDLYSERAVNIIKEHDVTKPLYISLHYTAPHEPLEVPSEFLDFYPNVADPLRRTYLSMIMAMDQAVGKVVQALIHKEIFSNTIIVFTSDNGGVPGPGGASNAPLRGEKFTLWEGGTRSPTFVYSQRHIFKPRRVSHELFHIVDWMPTLLSAAGARKSDRKIDGIDQWAMISNGTSGRRQSFVYNIFKDDFNAFRFGHMKLIEGNPAGYRDRRKKRSVKKVDMTTELELEKILKDANVDLDLEEILRIANLDLFVDSDRKRTVKKGRQLSADQIVDLLSALESRPPSEQLVCRCQLYDLRADPTERTDLAAQKPLLVKFLFYVFKLFKKQEVPLVLDIPRVVIPESHPLLYNGTISFGWC